MTSKETGGNLSPISQGEGLPLPIFQLHAPQSEVIPTIHSLIADLQETAADGPKEKIDRTRRQFVDSTRVGKVIATMVDFPGETSEEGFRLLADDLAPLQEVNQQEELRVSMLKLWGLAGFYFFLKVKEGLSQQDVGHEAKRFGQLYERLLATTGNTLANFGLPDLRRCIELAELISTFGPPQ